MPGIARGRAATVLARTCASFKQGIWMMSFGMDGRQARACSALLACALRGCQRGSRRVGAATLLCGTRDCSASARSRRRRCARERGAAHAAQPDGDADASAGARPLPARGVSRPAVVAAGERLPEPEPERAHRSPGVVLRRGVVAALPHRAHRRGEGLHPAAQARVLREPAGHHDPRRARAREPAGTRGRARSRRRGATRPGRGHLRRARRRVGHREEGDRPSLVERGRGTGLRARRRRHA